MIEKVRVLIADDNESLSRSMSFVLKRKGCTAATARNGIEAINEVKKKFFDVVFIDIKMPGLNGVETLKKIMKISPTIMAVMMTAYAVEELVQEALKEGAHGVIYKPLDMEEVFKVIGIIKVWKQQQGEES